MKALQILDDHVLARLESLEDLDALQPDESPS